MTLVDSSSWIEAFRASGDPGVRARVRALMESGEAAWCDLIRLELWNGAGGPSEKKTLRLFDREVPRLEITAAVWSLACDLASRARDAGLSIPATDILIFACARHHGTSLEHCDEHFTRLERMLA